MGWWLRVVSVWGLNWIRVPFLRTHCIQKLSLGVYTYCFYLAYPFMIICHVRVTGAAGLVKLSGVKKLLLQTFALKRGRYWHYDRKHLQYLTTYLNLVLRTGRIQAALLEFSFLSFQYHFIHFLIQFKLVSELTTYPFMHAQKNKTGQTQCTVHVYTRSSLLFTHWLYFV